MEHVTPTHPSNGTTTSDPSWLQTAIDGAASRDAAALVVAWSLREPERVGEVFLPPEPGQPAVLGRGAGNADERRVPLLRQRPGGLELRPPLTARAISHRQLELTQRGEALLIKRIGRAALMVNGRVCDEASVHPGDVVRLQEQLLLLCVKRPRRLPDAAPQRVHAFGRPDAHGIVGESVQAWRLRSQLEAFARNSRHLLILGPSGSGKELVAQALHEKYGVDAPLVTRNAATFPPGLIDAELFGSIRDYPNAGMPERRGLVGEAHGGTLFLDEIGELPESLQSHLLRVLDAGEYQRLGASRSERARFRLIAATSRHVDKLIPEFAARFTIRFEVPSLDDRRDDIPLIARELMCRAARSDPTLAERFFEAWDGSFGYPRIDPVLLESLLQHHYTTNVRELDGLLWEAMLASRDPFVSASTRQTQALGIGNKDQDDTADPTADDIRSALERHGGSVTASAKALGLSSRFVLYRLLRKYDIDADAFRPDEDDEG